jgi:hypothetical protein
MISCVRMYGRKSRPSLLRSRPGVPSNLCVKKSPGNADHLRPGPLELLMQLRRDIHR